ncbi:MAG: LysM peptidoglycan-binding domain-containing protein [Mollicutes bacterium]|nr:LysM peptidoglycan-binding domain-containing protein [Mollicutes bacterium]
MGENENIKSKNRKKAVGIILGAAATSNALSDVARYIISCNVERTTDGTPENTVGYEGYNIRFNTRIHSNNFVVLHVSEKTINDITGLRDTLNQCKDKKISVSIVLDTKAENLAKMYKDIDFLQSILKQYNIDMPVYCNIDNIMNNKNLNNAEKSALIEAFLDKATRSNIYVGLYGTDTNLYDCNEFITKISEYDTFLIQDNETIRYQGTHNITKDLEGNISATVDLSSIVANANLNASSSLVYSSNYIVAEGETMHSIALKCGLSENDLIKYNGNKKTVEAGDKILIPNLYMTINEETKEVKYNFAIARGIDISNYQYNIDWERVAQTSDYVIVEVARDDNDYLNNDGYYLDSAIGQIIGTKSQNLDLGLYFCIYKDMDASTYEERMESYLTRLDNELRENNVNIDKSNIPVFLDFDVYSDDNDYYELMQTFEKVCASHGFTKVGIYGNESTLNSICENMQSKHGLVLKNTDYYVWKAGGPQYSSNESIDPGVRVEDLVEYRGESTSNFTVDMQQVTNVCNNVGASNGANHCDVSYLYDEEMFGRKYKEDETTEIMEVDLNNYRNIPVNSICSGALNTLTGLTALCYAALGLKTLGKKLKQKHKERIKKQTLEK